MADPIPRHAEATKATLDRGPVRRPGLDLRAQARRHPLPRVPRRRHASRSRSRNDLSLNEPLSRGRRGARGSSRQALRRRRRGGRRSAAADELRARCSSAGTTARSRSSSTCSTCCTSTARTCRAARCASARRLLRDALAFDDPLRFTPPPQPRRRGVLPRGVPQGLGGGDRQARRRAVHARPLARLAEVQVLGRAGVRDRRLHRAEGQPHRLRRAAGRLLRRRRAPLRGQGRHRLRRARRCATSRSGSPRSQQRRLAVRRRAAASARATGSSRSSSPRSASPSGRATAGCAIRASSGLRDDKAARDVVRERPS